MKLKTRIGITLASIVVLSLAVVSLLVAGLKVAQANLHESEGMDILVTDLYDLRILSLEYENAPLARVARQWRAKHDEIGKGMRAARGMDPEIEEAFVKLRILFEDLAEMATVTGTGANPLRLRLMGQLFSTLHVESQRIIDWARRGSLESQDAFMRRQRDTGAEILAALAALAAIASTVIFFTGRRILSSISLLRAGTESIARGDLEHRMKTRGSDELTEVFVSFNAMAQDLQASHAERGKAEDELRRNLEEKEILLREVHHRVKNNLTVISSLLNLQSSSIENPEQALAAFRNSADRIMAMALVHEELYKSRDYARMDMGDYVEKMTESLLQAYCPGGNIRLSAETKGIILSVNTAIPCGLILNELITNAFKHAFPGERSGEIRVRLKALDGETFELSVVDNGIGMATQPEGQEGGSLGLTLVRLLVDQLHGSMETSNEEGTGFRILFRQK
jgi:two-component sensor histidine kinase/HAMP domain-containing protein